MPEECVKAHVTLVGLTDHLATIVECPRQAPRRRGQKSDVCDPIVFPEEGVRRVCIRVAESGDLAPVVDVPDDAARPPAGATAQGPYFRHTPRLPEEGLSLARR